MGTATLEGGGESLYERAMLMYYDFLSVSEAVDQVPVS